MCLAVPMKLMEIDENRIGTGDIDGVRHKVNMGLLEDVSVGDFVIVHAGYAIEKLDQEEAEKRLTLFDELAEHRAKLK